LLPARRRQHQNRTPPPRECQFCCPRFQASISA
jgi:hypothetical protein